MMFTKMPDLVVEKESGNRGVGGREVILLEEEGGEWKARQSFYTPVTTA